MVTRAGAEGQCVHGDPDRSLFTEPLCFLRPQLQNDISGIELPTFQYLQNPGIDYLIISVGSHPHNRLWFLSQQLNRMRRGRQQGKAVIMWLSQMHISQAGSSWWLAPGLEKPLNSAAPGWTQTVTASQQAQHYWASVCHTAGSTQTKNAILMVTAAARGTSLLALWDQEEVGHLGLLCKVRICGLISATNLPGVVWVLGFLSFRAQQLLRKSLTLLGILRSQEALLGTATMSPFGALILATMFLFGTCNQLVIGT